MLLERFPNRNLYWIELAKAQVWLVVDDSEPAYRMLIRDRQILSLLKPDEVEDALWLIDVFERWMCQPRRPTRDPSLGSSCSFNPSRWSSTWQGSARAEEDPRSGI